MSNDLTDPAEEINRLHSEILAVARQTLEKAIRIGELLIQQKAVLKHGQWFRWLRQNVQFHQRTAQRYMRVFENRERLKSDSVSLLNNAYKLLDHPGREAAKPRVGKEAAENITSLLHEAIVALEDCRWMIGKAETLPEIESLINRWEYATECSLQAHRAIFSFVEPDDLHEALEIYREIANSAEMGSRVLERVQAKAAYY